MTLKCWMYSEITQPCFCLHRRGTQSLFQDCYFPSLAAVWVFPGQRWRENWPSHLLASFGIVCTLTKKEVIRNKNKSDLDYPFALPKYILTALNKCCPWSSTSRFCSFLWSFGKNRAEVHHPQDSYLSVLIFVSLFLLLLFSVLEKGCYYCKSFHW